MIDKEKLRKLLKEIIQADEKDDLYDWDVALNDGLNEQKMKQSSVEWLAEKYNYVFWLRNRDEISSQQGDEYRIKYLQIAREMHKDEIIDAYLAGEEEWLTTSESGRIHCTKQEAYKYYDDTFTK